MNASSPRQHGLVRWEMETKTPDGRTEPVTLDLSFWFDQHYTDVWSALRYVTAATKALSVAGCAPRVDTLLIRCLRASQTDTVFQLNVTADVNLNVPFASAYEDLYRWIQYPDRRGR